MVEKIKTAIDENLLRQSFLYTFIIGLVAHGYCFLNLMVSHDSLNDFYVSDQWERAGFGRIFYSSYIALTRGRIVLPWLIGILALFWISIAVYLILKMFHIQKKGLVLLVSGICVTNPTVYALAATYIHDLDADMFAMMLAAVSVYLWSHAIGKETAKKKIFWLIAGALSLSIALGTYQSYISVAITLIILYLLKELLEKKTFKDVFMEGCCGIGMLIIAAGFYLIELKIFEILTGVSTVNSQNYNGLGNLSQVLTGDVVGNILNTYVSFVNAIKNSILTSYPESLSLVLYGILAFCIIGIALLGLKTIDWKSKGLFAVLSALLPFGMNITYFLSGGVGHVLTQYAVWMLFLLALILSLWAEKKNVTNTFIRKAFYILVTGCLVLVIAENVQTANSVYMKKDLEYQATLSYMTRVADRMEEQEDYVPGETPVMFIGENAVGNSKIGFERYEIITGAGENGSVTYYDTYKDYFKYVLARPISICYEEELKNSQEVLEMSVFPKEGSVKMVDGVLVVKLEEN